MNDRLRQRSERRTRGQERRGRPGEGADRPLESGQGWRGRCKGAKPGRPRLGRLGSKGHAQTHEQNCRTGAQALRSTGPGGPGVPRRLRQKAVTVAEPVTAPGSAGFSRWVCTAKLRPVRPGGPLSSTSTTCMSVRLGQAARSVWLAGRSPAPCPAQLTCGPPPAPRSRRRTPDWGRPGRQPPWCWSCGGRRGRARAQGLRRAQCEAPGSERRPGVPPAGSRRDVWP